MALRLYNWLHISERIISDFAIGKNLTGICEEHSHDLLFIEQIYQLGIISTCMRDFLVRRVTFSAYDAICFCNKCGVGV